MKQFIVSMSIILIIVSLCSAQGITFGLVADPQYSTAAASGGRYYNTSLTRLQQATDTFQIHSMRFVAILGDFINAYTATDTALALRDYDSVNTRLTHYSGDRYAVIGNHDCVSTSKPEFMARIACQIPQKYYSFDKGNYHFVVLDCNYNPDSTDFGHNNFTWNSALIPAREKQWLINDLAAAGSKSVFVFMHNVVDNTTSGEQILNSAEIRTVFETAGNVKAVFSGHKHSGGYWTSNGIHYLTMKGMVEQAPPANAFSEATVTAADDSLLIKGYSNQTSYNLKLKATVISAPAAPILSVPANTATNTTTYPTLSWGTVTGAVTYRVQVSTISTFATTVADDSTLAVGTKAITGLANSTTYYWKANAKNAGGTSAWSTLFSFTTLPAAPGVPVLATPANAAPAVAIAPTLTWGTMTGAATYRIQVSTISTFATTVVDDSTPTAGTKAVTGLANNTTYYWQVNAKNAGGTSAYSNVFSFTTVPVTSGVPALTAPSDGATGIAIAPTLTWGTVTGAATYRVQVSTISTFATTVVNDSTLTVGTKAITGLANNTTYYWQVNAKNAGGTSAWSTLFSFKTATTGVIAATPHYVPVTMGHNGVLEVYMANGSRVMQIAYGASATRAQLLNTASKTLAKGYYTYRFHSAEAKNDIVGKLVK